MHMHHPEIAINQTLACSVRKTIGSYVLESCGLR